VSEAVVYGGLLASLTEAVDLQEELGVSFDEAMRLQRQRADERLAQVDEISNVIPFGPRP
jgi:hypothetical protein